jgi:hypothetical protein
MGRDQYTKAQRDAWQAERIAGEAARGLHSTGINSLPKVSAFKQALAEGLNAKNPNRQPLAQVGHNTVSKIKHAKHLAAGIDSECFSSLEWEGGIATATFARNGAIYEYELTREEFLEWVASGSLGQYFNAEIR